MGIKFLKKSKPESERVEDDAKVRITVEETLKDIELRGDVAVKSLSQKFDGYEPENFQLNEISKTKRWFFRLRCLDQYKE